MALSGLKDLERNLYKIEKVSRFSSPENSRLIQKILANSPLIEKSAEIGLSFELATRLRPSRALIPSIARAIRQVSGVYGINLSAGIFEDEGTIPLFRMVTGIDRLLPIVQEIGSSFYRRTQSDDEIFKPSGVDPEQVKVYIDKALINISSDHQLDKNMQDRLVEYLLEANAELAIMETNSRNAGYRVRYSWRNCCSSRSYGKYSSRLSVYCRKLYYF